MEEKHDVHNIREGKVYAQESKGQGPKSKVGACTDFATGRGMGDALPGQSDPKAAGCPGWIRDFWRAQVVDFQVKHRKTSDYVALCRFRNVAQSHMRDFAGSEVFPYGQCAPTKAARFRAQVVDFPYLQKGKLFGVGRLGPLGAASLKTAGGRVTAPTSVGGYGIAEVTLYA